ncbi:YchJ family protein [Marinobacter sp.]|uniref:YchJ family protein n=1 Tax=Marinobacter sp. TaxID=50741 RepID=UPI003561A93E
MNTVDQPSGCPCGSGKTYSHCCQPLHLGQPAPSPEALMRSRFAAFVLKDQRYLRATWHPDTRPSELELDHSPAWTSLQIIAGREVGNQGEVYFRATYRAGQGWGFLEERSDFVKEGDHWYYLTGDTREGLLKPGRNDPCPCGSGRKYKVCCLGG